MAQARKKFKYFDTQNQTFTQTGYPKLWRIIVPSGTASAVFTVYNGTTTSDPVVAAVDATVELSLDFGGCDLTALHAVLSGAAGKVTLIYS